MTTSLVVLPSPPPGALSGSLDVTETRSTEGLGSPLSDVSMVAFTVTYFLFGGQSTLGDADTPLCQHDVRHLSLLI